MQRDRTRARIIARCLVVAEGISVNIACWEISWVESGQPNENDGAERKEEIGVKVAHNSRELTFFLREYREN